MRELSRILRELAATCWRAGDLLQAAALHTEAIKIEAGIVDAPADPHEAIRARMRELGGTSEGMGR